MLPRMEPISEALTTSCRPAPSATRAMISSGALPKVTLSRPPMPGPERAASSSVARPMSAAVGITPSAEAKKISGAPAWATSSAMASGMNGRSHVVQPNQERMAPTRTGGLPAREGRALLDLGHVAAGGGDAVEVLRGARRARGGRRRRGGGPAARRATGARACGAAAEQLLEVRQRPGVLGLGDVLVLVEVADAHVEEELAGGQPARARTQRLGDVDVDRQLQPPQRLVVLARPD